MKPAVILVVEDEALVAMEIKEDLERLGYSVPDVVDTGEAVLPAVAHYRPDLLLIDIKIQGSIDGIEAAYMAKAEFDIPIIYLTAYSDETTLKRAARTNPAMYLLKPFDERELAANIEMALAKSRSMTKPRSGAEAFGPIIDAIKGPAIASDEEGRIAHANQAACSLLKLGGPTRAKGLPLDSVLVGYAGAENRMKGRFPLRDGTSAKPGTSAHIEPLEAPDGSVFGSLVLFESMDSQERELLESSASEANDAIHDLLPRDGLASPILESAGRLVSCPSGAGDLYDIFSLDDDLYAFYDLDVMGHGTLPSLFAYALHDVIRSLARLPAGEVGPLSPADLIGKLNTKYVDEASARLSFFTIAFGVINARTGEYLMARAGHPAAMSVPLDGLPQAIEIEGTAVGAFGSIKLEECSGRLEPGDKLILFSDGLLEALGGRDLAKGYETAIGLVVELGRADAATMVNRLVAAAEQAASRSPLRDDASILVVGRPGP